MWAIAPPLLVLIYYHHRVLNAPPLSRLLLSFSVGAISGLVALNLEAAIESLIDWEQMTQSLFGVASRQLLEVAPIEESTKLLGVLLLQGSRPKRKITLFLFTVAVALGFTAQENWVYLTHNGSIFDRLIGTPVHALFSAPWGYTLGLAKCSRFRSYGDQELIFRAWLNAVICHALVNVLSTAWHYSPPINWLSYGLFPFFLWMFWRFEQLFKRSQDKLVLNLISSSNRLYHYGKLGLSLLAFVLGGNAIFGIFLLFRKLKLLHPAQLFSANVKWLIIRRCGLNLILGLVAWGIYRYLQSAARKQIHTSGLLKQVVPSNDESVQ